MARRIRIVQLGCGYWGPNLLRNFAAQPACELVGLIEFSAQRREFAKSLVPSLRTFASIDDLSLNEYDAVVIATPADTHFALAKRFMSAGKHVFVEKPLALNVSSADELTALARANGLTLMVGHTFLYNNAIRELKSRLDSGQLGKLQYIYSQRLNLGQVRADVNAWWNLAPHDVSILLYLRDGKLPQSVTSRGLTYIQEGIEDVVFATLLWEDGTGAHIHVSWLDPRKIRQITAVCDGKMVVYDDISSDKLAIYDKGVDRVPRLGEQMHYDQTASNTQLVHRSGDIVMPYIKAEEPLKVESAHFLQCIESGDEPISGPKNGRDTVAVLEAVQRSLKSGRTEDVS